MTMSGDTQILRQYLVSLGFKVDEASNRKFDFALGKTNLQAKVLVGTLIGVGTATAAMVNRFARGMEQMYYAGRKAESTVGNLQAIEFAASTIGISGDTMRGAIEGMARAIRSNPGLGALLESLGVVASGDRTKDMVALMERLKGMPFWLGEKFAQMFGMDPDTYLLMTENLEKFKEMAALRKQMASDAGVDADAAARASVEYGNMLDRLKSRISLLKDAMALDLLPYFTSFMTDFEAGLGRLTRSISKRGVLGTIKEATGEVTQKPPGKEEPFFRWALGAGAYDTVADWLPKGGPVRDDKRVVGDASPGQVKAWTRGEEKSAAYLDKLKKWAEGLVTWAVPGAKATATQPSAAGGLYGHAWLDMLYEDLKNGAQFSSPEVQQRVMNSRGLAPLGTGPTGASGGPVVTIHQQTEVHVTAPDPEAAGRAVSRAQGDVAQQMSTTIRNNLGAPR